MPERRVVITGVGPVSPVGIGKDEFLAALRSGKVGIQRITAFDPSNFRSQIGGQISALRCRDYVPKWYRKSVKVMARDIELAVAAADCAVRDSGLRTKTNNGNNINVDPARLGVNIGAGLICPDLTELGDALSTAAAAGDFSLELWGKDGMNNLTPLWLLKYLPNMLACHVSIIHDAQAPSNTITCAEASSHLAIGEAYRTIARGAADVSLCGGAESKLNPMGLLRQDLVGHLTVRGNDDPAKAVRPFDKSRSGTAVAEGGAVVVLEELAHALDRGARIYCELVGMGSSFGTEDFIFPEAGGGPISLATEKALKDASISSGEVDLVYAFACGLKEHDRAEALAIKQVFDNTPVTSIKGQVGNSGAGSGALDVVAGVLSLSEGYVPATTNFENPDEQCPVHVATEAGQRDLDVVVTVSYSLSGGQVSALVFRRWTG